MPGPGEQIQMRTQERDAMFGRMASTVLRQPNELHTALLGPVEKTAPGLVGIARPGDLLRAVGGGETREVIVDVLRTYSNIGAGEATPDHQWRAAEHFRPFYAADALVQAVEKLIERRVADALRVPAGISASAEGDDAAGASFP